MDSCCKYSGVGGGEYGCDASYNEKIDLDELTFGETQ